jgi:hypothetical protein
VWRRTSKTGRVIKETMGGKEDEGKAGRCVPLAALSMASFEETANVFPYNPFLSKIYEEFRKRGVKAKGGMKSRTE